MAIKRLRDLDVAGKHVFCRLDLNVPLDDQARVTDDTRIRACLPTLEALLERGARLICASHLGRPKGKVVAGLRMEPVGAALAELLGGSRRVLVTDEPSGDGARKVVADAREGDVVLLENLRFDPRETQNDETFARELASMTDVYVNDAFGTAHRAHASTAGMVAHVDQKGAGLLMMKEVEMLGALLGEVERPFVALLGGAKVSDKIQVLESLLKRVDALLVGGAMANTFLAANGADVGTSKVEEDGIPLAAKILEQAQRRSVELLLPVDAVVADRIDADRGTVCDSRAVPAGQMALDIGPQTRGAYRDKLLSARTIFWNGPMGVFEREQFAAGTMETARAVADSAAMSVVGGGDSVSAIKKSGVAEAISHISTGGGASLEFLTGAKLPGIAALEG